ncbi:MAG: hypothetical protein JWN14_4451 [Chthonomonadales bacterium]|nr:hypothetical protein [Chthonomonadales bacterium]
MSNLHKLRLITNEPHPRQWDCEDQIEDFLDHLSAPLIGIVPYRERLAFRQEAHAHIDGLIREFQYEGQEPAQATESALREFGEPWKVGQAFLQEWSQGTPGQPQAGQIRKAFWTAFGGFGVASMLTLLILESNASRPPDGNLTFLAGMLAFCSPFVAGSFVGAMAPVQAKRGMGYALGILMLHSCAVGALMPFDRGALRFALWQLLFWLPAGIGSAALTAACLRYVRRQRFWLIAR